MADGHRAARRWPRGPVPPAHVVSRTPARGEPHGCSLGATIAPARPKAEAIGVIARLRPHTPAATAPPLIGIVTHELHAESEPAWAPAPGTARARPWSRSGSSLRLTYTQAVQEAGGIAVVVPAHGYLDDTAALLDRLDGLVFSGGPDLDPATYGHARHPQLGPDVDRISDEYGSRCWPPPPSATFPLLGICRGMQALNVSRGGTLNQHLPDITAVRAPPGARALRAGAPRRPSCAARGLHQLARTTELGGQLLPPSGHRRKSAPASTACATAPDGTIEAVCGPRERNSASASSGTPKRSPTGPSTPRCSRAWSPPPATPPVRRSRSSPKYAGGEMPPSAYSARLSARVPRRLGEARLGSQCWFSRRVSQKVERAAEPLLVGAAGADPPAAAAAAAAWRGAGGADPSAAAGRGGGGRLPPSAGSELVAVKLEQVVGRRQQPPFGSDG